MEDISDKVDKVGRVAMLGIELAGMVKGYFPEEIDPALDGDIALRNKAMELLMIYGSAS